MTTQKELSICSITYNLHGLTPTIREIENLFPNNITENYDMIVLGTQESLRSILVSIFYWDKSELEDLLNKHLSKFNYEKINSITLGPIHLIIYIKSKYLNDISCIGSDYIKNGFYGTISNKGAVYIWFKYKKISFLFINCHLAAHKNMQEQRINDFHRIIEEFKISNDNVLFYNSNKNNKNNKNNNNIFDFNNFDTEYIKGIDAINKFDVCIFLGDFNSRTELSMFEIPEEIKGNELLDFDQFLNSIQKKEIRIYNFNEASINFKPTYKLKENKYKIDSENHVPSYTDRVFYLSNDDRIKHFKVIKYDSLDFINFSDHKPVMFNFKISF